MKPGIYLFVLDRGFVIVGEVESVNEEMALFVELSRSRTVRRWGTAEGLAQLKDGPLPQTVLDACCRRSVPVRAILDVIH